MKRRPLVLILVFILGVAAVVSAQEDEPGLVPEGRGIPLTRYPTHEVSGIWRPIELEPVEISPLAGSQFSQGEAADLCVNAPELNLPGGGVTVTNNMTRSDDDPALSCMRGRPRDPGGYRTVWYKVTPEESGYLRVGTNGSTYDTVVAIYSSDLENACVNLQQLACNDDINFLSSQATLLALSGTTYFIEVADWQFEAPSKAIASLSAAFAPVNEWQVVGSLSPSRSRHVTVMDGAIAYNIGGQAIDASGFAVLLNITQSFDINTGNWQDLAKMCLPGQACPPGYSNTAAAIIARKIYLPSGYVGNSDEYDGTHWVYDIDSNSWTTAKRNSWENNEPTIYGTAAVVGSGNLTRYYYSGGLVGPMPLEGSVEDDAWSASDDTYVYLPAGNSWPPNPVPPMPVGRFGHVGAVQLMKDSNDNTRTYICVMSGLGKSQSGGPILITDGICYNTVSGGWDKNIEGPNQPRYFAGSAVDGDGNWYVFGGTDENGRSVPSTEVYDRQNNEWITLDSRFDLGDTSVLPLRPARSWPRGSFSGPYLFSFGGHRNEQSGDTVLGLVERTKIPRLVSAVPNSTVYLPVSLLQESGAQRNSTFATAQQIPLNQTISSQFAVAEDFADVFSVSVPSNRTIAVYVRDIPSGADYDLHVYNNNKAILGRSALPGNNEETVTINVASGLIYIVVERILPAPGSTPIPEPYHLLVVG